MWLINASTYRLEYFVDDSIAPPYAILSHTWEQDEVSFREFEDLERVRNKAGFQKIEYTCRQALEDGLNHAWVDTCCIDKSSSAELSESINSMFAWYSRAACCYVYMQDVPIWCSNLCDDMDPDDRLRGIDHDSPPSRHPSITPLGMLEAFRRSRWFTRGWTLQELLAPVLVQFRNRDWRQIAPLPMVVLAVSDVTGIDVDVLLHDRAIKHCVLAERFSWASQRSTTRVEDTAYCLLGLCGVNMPLLYGERSNAFRRLQDELIRTSDDASLLAWDMRPMNHLNAITYDSNTNLVFSATGKTLFTGDESGICHPLETTPLLATSPVFFRDCRLVRRVWWLSRPKIALDWSKYGLKARLPLLALSDTHGSLHVLLLGCSYGDGSENTPSLVCMFLKPNFDQKEGAVDDFSVISSSTGSHALKRTFLLRGISRDDASASCRDIVVRWSRRPANRDPEPNRVPGADFDYKWCQLHVHPSLELVTGFPRATWNLKAGTGLLRLKTRWSALVIKVASQVHVVLVLFLRSVFCNLKLRVPALRFVDIDDWPDVLTRLQAHAEPDTAMRAVDRSGFPAIPDDAEMMALLGTENSSEPEGKIWQCSLHIPGRGEVRAECSREYALSIPIRLEFIPDSIPSSVIQRPLSA